MKCVTAQREYCGWITIKVTFHPFPHQLTILLSIASILMFLFKKPNDKYLRSPNPFLL